MTSTLLRPRLTIVHPVSVLATSARSGLLYGTLGICAVGAGIVAIAGEGVLFRADVGLYAVFMGLAMLYARALNGSTVPGAIRVAEGALRFIRPRSAATLPMAMGVTSTTAGVLSLVAPAWTGEVFGLAAGFGPLTVWLGALTLLGAVWLVQQAWGLRLPPGLGVSALGLWGVRGGADVSLAWDDLESVSVVDSRTGARLAFALTDDSVIGVPRYDIGSDPNLVAVIIEHFRTHPEDREALGDADEAIRRVEAARA